MKLKSNVDLGAAFDVLKKALNESQETAANVINNEIPGMNFAKAFGTLRGGVEAVLTYVEDKEPEKQPEDDLPGGVFTGPGTSD